MLLGAFPSSRPPLLRQLILEAQIKSRAKKKKKKKKKTSRFPLLKKPDCTSSRGGVAHRKEEQTLKKLQRVPACLRRRRGVVRVSLRISSYSFRRAAPGRRRRRRRAK